MSTECKARSRIVSNENESSHLSGHDEHANPTTTTITTTVNHPCEESIATSNRDQSRIHINQNKSTEDVVDQHIGIQAGDDNTDTLPLPFTSIHNDSKDSNMTLPTSSQYTFDGSRMNDDISVLPIDLRLLRKPSNSQDDDPTTSGTETSPHIFTETMKKLTGNKDDECSTEKCDTQSDEEDEYNILHQQLKRLRIRRRKLQYQIHSIEDRFYPAWVHRYNAARHEHAKALSAYEGTYRQQMERSEKRSLLEASHPLQDLFYIWYRGPFATINGLRMGMEAVIEKRSYPELDHESDLQRGYSSASASSQVTKDSGQASGRSSPQPDTSINEFSISSLWGGTKSITAGQNQTEEETIIVSWSEINAALGAIALLLNSVSSPSPSSSSTAISLTTTSTTPLQTSEQSSPIIYSRKLYPRGSYSKISLSARNDNVEGMSTQEETYNLYYQDQSFGAFFFARRNFNIAVNALVGCVKEAIDTISTIDNSIKVPYNIVDITNESGQHDESIRYYSIRGIEVGYNGKNGQDWTRMMRYLAVDLKYIVAFVIRNVDF